MLNDQDKKDILADANNPQRRESFAQSRQKSLQPMTWKAYFDFLKKTQNFFGTLAKPHKITGKDFKL